MQSQQSKNVLDLDEKVDYTLIDNLTLFHSRRFFEETPSGIPGGHFTEETINALASHPNESAFLGFLESIVLHETCVIDHFTYAASNACVEVQSLFPECIRPVYLDAGVRDSIYDILRSRALGRDVEKALNDEQATIHKIYYRDTNPQPTNNILSFAGKYYEPEDDYKYHAISKGEYNPLNAVRSHFYVLLADRIQMPYSPHPWRARVIAESSVPNSITSEVVTHFTKNIGDALRRELAGLVRYMTNSPAPLIARKILLRAGKPKNVRDVALELRNSTRAKEFRKWCNSFREALKSGLCGVKELQKYNSTLNAALTTWSSDIDEGVKYRTRSIKFGIGFGGLKADAEGFSYKDPVVRVESKLKPLLFLNDIFRP